ncbi:MAG: DNA repair protein RecO [Planctomycetota bacterium]|nr:DNA repair protein RecO [Planctomycetota bacterium]
MSVEKTDGLVVRQTDWSETSRIVTFFTSEHGKISVVAKGARRLKSPFDAAIDLLSECRIVFIRKSSNSLDILTEAQLKQRFLPHGQNLYTLYGGYYVAELLDALTEEYDPHPNLYLTSIDTLSRLSKDGDPKLTIVRFELAVLREIGQLPAIDACGECGEMVQTGRNYTFWVSQGGLLCTNCRRPEYRHNLLQSETVAILGQLADESSSPHLSVTSQQFSQLHSFTTSAISYVLGRRPKMLRYLAPPSR